MNATGLHRVAACCLFVAAGRAVGHEIVQFDPSKRQPLALRIAKDQRGVFEADLRQAGYGAEKVEQIKQALASPHATVRWSALYLLTYHTGDRTVPALKEATRDPDVLVRAHAARLLHAFGDTSGIEVLRHDLVQFTPRNAEQDPNLAGLQGEELEQARKARFRQLQPALEVAEALSELGDASGLELSARMALKGENPRLRKDAIGVLMNLALQGESILAGQAQDPEAVLMAVAESETEGWVLTHLMFEAARLPALRAKRLLEKVGASPHFYDSDRSKLEYRLRVIEETIAQSRGSQK